MCFFICTLRHQFNGQFDLILEVFVRAFLSILRRLLCSPPLARPGRAPPRQVFHCASVVDFHHRNSIPAALRAVNVTGTEVMIAACRRNGVQALVYTATQARAGDHGHLHQPAAASSS